VGNDLTEGDLWQQQQQQQQQGVDSQDGERIEVTLGTMQRTTTP
jgi:hypothetical protein